MEKLEEKTHVFFAQELDFNFKALESLSVFFEAMKEFSHHLSENHYYSEAINRKIADANLRIHAAALELCDLEKQGSEFFVEVNKAVLAGKKPSNIDKKQFAAFKASVVELGSSLKELNASLKALVSEISREYSEKSVKGNL